MSSSTKFGFRPRALDVTRKLPIRIRKCRKTSPKVKRTVALGSSGMEKEEEMESHLQQAIRAQKATSAGDTVVNHVIPTPRVLPVDADEYDRIYQQERRLPRINKKLINFNGHVPFFLTQGSYNADSEDEEWLKTRRTITVDDFEHIIEKLETASPTADIIKPRDAIALLRRYDPGLVNDIYDYWLQKRKNAASKKSKCQVLIPKICTEVRREEKSVVNPYIAFRRRVDKVQTRKKQKTELMTYKSMLHVNFATKRSIVILDAMTQREKLKRSASDLDHSIYQLQYKRRLSNEQMDELYEQLRLEQRQANEKKSEPTTSGMTANDLDLSAEFVARMGLTTTHAVADKDIQRNNELWNLATMITQAHAAQTACDDSAEMEKVAAFDKNSSIDGRYQFRRKLGCQYRAALPTHNQNLLKDNQKLPPCPSYEELNQFQYMSTKYDLSDDGPYLAFNHGFSRKRYGRGNRLYIDLTSYPSDPPKKSDLDLVQM